MRAISLVVTLLFASSTFAREPADCANEQADFAAWMKTLPKVLANDCQLFGVPELVKPSNSKLAKLGRPRPNERAPIVSIRKDSVDLDGAPMWSPAEPMQSLEQRLGDQLRSLRDNYRRIQPNVPYRGLVILAAAPDVSWELFVTVAHTASDAGPNVLQVPFRLESVARPPRPSSIAGELDKLSTTDMQARARQLGALLGKVFSGCPSAVQALRSLSQIPPEKKVEVLAQKLPGVVADCGCRVDLAAAKQVLFASFSHDLACQTLTIRLAPAGRVVSARAQEPWSVTWERLADATKGADEAPVKLQIIH